MKKFLRTLLALIAAAAIAAVLYLILLDELVMPYLVDVPRVRVPRLRGQSVRQAEIRLQKSGLHLAIGDSLYHELLPPGTIVDQSLPPGQSIKRGRRITVDLSRGPRFYPVPGGVVGVSLREAQLQLETSQLLLGDITYISSATIPDGAFIVATPPSGTPLPRGTPVDLEISNGPPSRPKRIPLLLNLPIEQAEDSLRKYEMRLGNIASRIENDRPVGTVVAQSPGIDERALPLTPIDLVISVQETTAPWQDTVLETDLSPEESNDER